MPRHAILITLNHLAASLLGAYGQYRVKTPALDRLASRAALFHQALCHGVPEKGLTPTEDWAAHPIFREQLAEWDAAGVPIQIVTQTGDEPTREWIHEGVEAIRTTLSSGLPGVTWIQGVGIPDPWVPDHSGWEGEVARLLGTSWEELLADESPEMTAEQAIQELVAEGAFSRRTRQTAPDRVVNRLSLALYSACVEKLDERLGRLIREYQRHAKPDSLLIITGLQGDDLPREWPIERPVELHTERVRVPLFVQVGSGHAGGSSVLDLVQTTDIAPTLTEWLLPSESRLSVNLVAVSSKTASGQRFIMVESQCGETLIRTPEAQLVCRPANSDQHETDPIEWLTLKPEDAWDLLNVADQHHDLLESLRELRKGA